MANVHAAERKVNVIFNTFHHAQNMRREIRALCLRRFTYKFKAKSYETPEQIEARKAFEARELDKEVDYVINILRSISMHIRYANAIHPTIWAEYSERRLHQTLALADCSRLSAEIQFVIEDYGTDVNQWLAKGSRLCYIDITGSTGQMKAISCLWILVGIMTISGMTSSIK